MEMKDYTLTCGEVIDNLLMLADAYEKASAGKAPDGFLFNPTDAAANMKAAVHFIGSFGQQLPRWISVQERLPEIGVSVLAAEYGDVREMAWNGRYWVVPASGQVGDDGVTHWMPLPEPPEVQ